MANPRRVIALQINTQTPPFPAATAAPSSSSLPSSLLHFLKRPASFPFLLSLFVLLTWISLHFHQPTPSASLQHPTVAVAREAGLPVCLEADCVLVVINCEMLTDRFKGWGRGKD
ncbi:unnamed protein product [Triticum turgidum subsp. durum]|uniref:Uncharacterized protein n=1 Tax=Triticum turgidum subsp. durum TaxID=4567 RepID=A0A9R1S7B9_TRITD|nr:unnamed protein product [Triticum turgidum subsp. durum]